MCKVEGGTERDREKEMEKSYRVQCITERYTN